MVLPELTPHTPAVQPAIAVSWPMLVAAVAVIVAALETRLRKSFATEKDLNGFGERVQRTETLYLATQDAAARSLEKATLVEERLEQHRQWLTESVIKTLDHVAASQEAMGRQTAALGAVVQEQGKLLDRVSERLDRTGGER